MQYGAKMIQWAPFAATDPEPADALPKYGAPLNLGALNKVSETLNFNEASAYGDDMRKVYVREFSNGNVVITILDLPNATASAVLGAKLDSGGSNTDLHFSGDDEAPYGGLAFFTTNLTAEGTRYWKGIYYPKVKASMAGREFNTKGESIVLTSPELTFSVFACATGDYKIESAELTTEAAAVAWVHSKIPAAT